VNLLLPELNEAVYFLDSLIVEYPFTKEEKTYLLGKMMLLNVILIQKSIFMSFERSKDWSKQKKHLHNWMC